MTKLKTTTIAVALTLSSTSVFADDDKKTGVTLPVTTASSFVVLTPKPAVLLEPTAASAPAGHIVRIVHEPIAIPVVRKATMNSNRQFVYSSE